MKYFHVHPDDSRRLARWLRSNLCGFVIVGGLLSLIGKDATTDANRSPSVLGTVAIGNDSMATGRPISHSPEGWRRTINGWEDTSTWAPIPKPIGEWIETQQAREPAWAKRLLEELREMPPLIFAMCQITAVTAVVVLTQRRDPID